MSSAGGGRAAPGKLLVEILLDAWLRRSDTAPFRTWDQWVPRRGPSAHPAHPFTGSTETGRRRRDLWALHKRLSSEMGGKNAQIVLDDADLDIALEGALCEHLGRPATMYRYQSSILRADTTMSGNARGTGKGLKLATEGRRGLDVGPLIRRCFEESRD